MRDKKNIQNFREFKESLDNNSIDYKLKHIDDLEVGDEIITTIPGVCDVVNKVVFINRDLNFVFTEGNSDDLDDEEQTGIKFSPNKEGYFKVPV